MSNTQQQQKLGECEFWFVIDRSICVDAILHAIHRCRPLESRGNEAGKQKPPRNNIDYSFTKGIIELGFDKIAHESFNLLST